MLTNNQNLPESLVSAIRNDPYRSVSDISTTRIIRPYQQVALQKRYSHKIIEDASGRIYALIGKNTHHIIERVEVDGAVKEWTFYANILGWLVSGTIDSWERTLWDWKVTSIWAVKDGVKPEVEAQMNVNKYLIEQSPYKDFVPIDSMKVVNIYRDWSKLKSLQRGYPKSQVGIQDVNVWDEMDIWFYIHGRIKNHQVEQDMPDEFLTPCTPSERWEKPTVYAVHKEGRKSAVKLFNDMEPAEKFIENHKDKKKLYINIRQGESTRCEHYCNVSSYCKQYMGMDEPPF